MRRKPPMNYDQMLQVLLDDRYAALRPLVGNLRAYDACSCDIGKILFEGDSTVCRTAVAIIADYAENGRDGFVSASSGAPKRGCSGGGDSSIGIAFR